MRKRTRLGLILVGALTLAWAHQPHTHQVKLPKDLVVVGKKATWEEKGENKDTAKQYAWVAFGWRGKQWLCLHDLWTRESRFDHLATNQQGSSAFGIAQMLGEQSRDPRVQILRGLRYIEQRYTTPCRALAFHNKRNHY
jgi:hypothetical protein